MHCPKSLHFSVSFLGSPVRKLAPGLIAEYKVVFTPREVKDYNHQLVFSCKEDVFNVPIIGMWKGKCKMADSQNRILFQIIFFVIGLNKIALS